MQISSLLTPHASYRPRNVAGKTLKRVLREQRAEED